MRGELTNNIDDALLVYPSLETIDDCSPTGGGRVNGGRVTVGMDLFLSPVKKEHTGKHTVSIKEILHLFSTTEKLLQNTNSDLYDCCPLS